MINVIDPLKGCTILSIFDDASVSPREPFFNRLMQSAVETKLLPQYTNTSTQVLGTAPIRDLPPTLENYLKRQDYLFNAAGLFSNWAFTRNEDYTPPKFNPVSHTSIRGSDLLVGHSPVGNDHYLLEASRAAGSPPYFTPSYQPLISFDSRDAAAYAIFRQAGFNDSLAYWNGTQDLSHSLDVTMRDLGNSRVYQYALYRILTNNTRHHISAHRLIVEFGDFPEFFSSTDLVTLGAGARIHWSRLVIYDDYHSAGVIDRYSGTWRQDDFLSLDVSTDNAGWQILGTYYPMYAFSLSQVPGVAAEILDGVDYGLGNPRFPIFEKIAIREAPEAAGILAFAAADAANVALDDLEINAVEHLSELRELFGLVSIHGLMSEVVKLIRSGREARKFRRKIRPGKLLWTILDLLADARLMYSFALAPSYEDAQAIADRAMGLRADTIDYLSGVRMVTYGKAYWDISDYIPEFQDTGITGRAKLVVKPDPDSWLVSLLPLKTVGLFAEFAAIWETIPFTFVSDYFFDLGGLLETVDETRYLYALNVLWSELSTTMRWDLDEEFLALIGAGSAGVTHEDEIAPHFRAYNRLAMRGFPAFVPSRMWTHTLTDWPPVNWATVSALLYRLGKR